MDDFQLSTKDLQSIVLHIQDVAKSYDPNADPTTMSKQLTNLRGVANQFLHTVSSPDEILWRNVISQIQTITLKTALRLGVFRAVPVGGSISRKELAEKVNASESFIERQMRVLIGTGIFDHSHLNSGHYEHNRVSKSMIETDKPGTAPFFIGIYDIYTRPMVEFDRFLDEYCKNGVFSEPSSNYVNPFVRYYGTKGQTTWEALNNDPDLLRRFHLLMRYADHIAPPITTNFDFNQFKSTSPDDDRIQLVDIGGGDGAVVLQILSQALELDPKRCILQDTADVIALAHNAKANGVQTQVIDFHKGQPVKGAKAYYMSHISHDYQDDALINILTHIRDAMAPDSKLLIADCVMPENLDESTIKAGALDQLMLIVAGAERTESGFADVLGKVGLELVKVFRVDGSAGAIIECKKVDRGD